MNGPVPTGLRFTFSGSAADAGETMTPLMPDNTFGNAVQATANVIFTVIGSTTSTAVMFFSPAPLYAETRWRSRLNLTAAASNGVPS